MPLGSSKLDFHRFKHNSRDAGKIICHAKNDGITYAGYFLWVSLPSFIQGLQLIFSKSPQILTIGRYHYKKNILKTVREPLIFGFQ